MNEDNSKREYLMWNSRPPVVSGTGPAFSEEQSHRGWFSRGYLPHFDRPDLAQSITFRLFDSLPEHVLVTIDNELKFAPSGDGDRERRKRIMEQLDAGHGACWLRRPEIAGIVEEALLYFDGDRYRLLSWVIMPNHVHVIIEAKAGHLLSGIIYSWKSFTAKAANRRLNRNGTFWNREYHDRFIRDAQHLAHAIRYVHNNPVKAGLCARAEDWPFSSARHGVQASPDAAH
jgi:REP element-mobilizing transposase RayT